MESLNRREFLNIAGLGSAMCLFPSLFSGSQAWAQDQKKAKKSAQKSHREPVSSVILLWLAGGPSQLDTFDPKPGEKIANGTKAIKTAVKGVQLAEGFDALAAEMKDVALIRSVTSAEGDHERATYHIKTGYRPEPAIKHPSLGALACHERPAKGLDVPSHISIFPNRWSAWGGFLGNEYDAFRMNDPKNPVPDVRSKVKDERFEKRLKDLDVLEKTFRKGRAKRVQKTGHRDMVKRARSMMKSKQIEAFDISKEPEKVRKAYGETAFGRGVLAARRLVEVGVRWVEVTLDGWDSHVNNNQVQRGLVKTLDPAFASLIKDLRERDLLKSTLVLCMGEFGRTPKVNAVGGRDHWPKGFSMALAGGPVRGGLVHGETDPKGSKDVKDPVSMNDVSATVLHSLGLKPKKELITPVQRPIKLSDGKVIKSLLKAG